MVYPTTLRWRRLSLYLACSAGGFGGFHLSIFLVFSRHFGFAADWENWGENERMSEGMGGGEWFFFPLPLPLPLPLPQFFFLPPTRGKLFTSPQLHCFSNSRWRPEHSMGISTLPAKIRLHCRLGTKKDVFTAPTKQSLWNKGLFSQAKSITQEKGKSTFLLSWRETAMWKKDKQTNKQTRGKTKIYRMKPSQFWLKERLYCLLLDLLTT